MIYFLIVVTVGGTSSITGPFLASLLLGIGDVAGKYYVPKLGAFVIYAIMIVGPDLAAAGLVRPQRGAVTAGWLADARRRRLRLSQAPRPLVAARDRILDFRLRDHLAVPGKYLILKDTAILALFALSLDLILGYAGIISLGQAAFFGLAGYFSGLVAKYGIINEPVIALIFAGLVAAALGFVTSFLVLRGSDLTRLMVTLGVSLMLGEVANRYSDITGGADGLQGVDIAPIFGRFRFDLYGHNGYVYCLIVLFVCFVIARRIVYSPFGLSLRAVKGNALRAAAIGIPVKWRLVAIYTDLRRLCRHRRRAARPRPPRSARSTYSRWSAPPISCSS